VSLSGENGPLDPVSFRAKARCDSEGVLKPPTAADLGPSARAGDNTTSHPGRRHSQHYVDRGWRASETTVDVVVGTLASHRAYVLLRQDVGQLTPPAWRPTGLVRCGIDPLRTPSRGAVLNHDAPIQAMLDCLYPMYACLCPHGSTALPTMLGTADRLSSGEDEQGVRWRRSALGVFAFASSLTTQRCILQKLG
jgi:hypothetical protein